MEPTLTELLIANAATLHNPLGSVPERGCATRLDPDDPLPRRVGLCKSLLD